MVGLWEELKSLNFTNLQNEWEAMIKGRTSNIDETEDALIISL